MVDLEKKFPLFILILLKAYNAVVTSVRITSRNTSKYSITIGLQQRIYSKVCHTNWHHTEVVCNSILYQHLVCFAEPYRTTYQYSNRIIRVRVSVPRW